MTMRKIEVGPLVALVGAVVLLVSLFLNWFKPALTAWDVFEVLDLVLAALAIVAALAAVGLAGAPLPRLAASWLGWSAAAALVIVVATLLNHPPAAAGADPDIGLWLALAGSALMAAGALLSVARVHIHLDVEQRRTRTAAVDARRRTAGEPSAAQPATAATSPLGGAAPATPAPPWEPAADPPPRREPPTTPLPPTTDRPAP